MLRRDRLCLAWLALQLLLIVSFASRDTLLSITEGPTILPSSLKSFSENAEGVLSTALGQQFRTSNPYREAIATYANVAGIQAGYGYYGPNVPGTYQIVFELHYPSGRLEYALPQVSSVAAGLRVSRLLDEIGQTKYEQLREILVRMLAQSVWREHPEAKTVHAVFEWIRLPRLDEFERGKKQSSEVLYTHDFTQTDLK